MHKITTCLWFKQNAEEAINFYTKIFKDSEITSTQRYGKDSPFPEGTLLAASININDTEIQIINGGPEFSFTPAISLVVKCDNQEEIDYYWNELLKDGGVEEQCGWLKDKYGLSWQIIPHNIGELIANPNAMQKMLGMKKLIIKELVEA